MDADGIGGMDLALRDGRGYTQVTGCEFEIPLRRMQIGGYAGHGRSFGSTPGFRGGDEAEAEFGMEWVVDPGHFRVLAKSIGPMGDHLRFAQVTGLMNGD